MALKVTISERAEKNLDDIMLYLEEEWSIRVRDNFRKKLIKAVEQIAKSPELFPSSAIKKNVRRCVVTKQTSLYYRISNQEIEIITIQDNRKNPQGLRL